MQYCNDKFNNNLHDVKSTWKVINKILKLNSKKQNDFQIEEMAPSWAIAPKLPMLLMIIFHQLHHILLPKSQMLGFTP